MSPLSQSRASARPLTSSELRFLVRATSPELLDEHYGCGTAREVASLASVRAEIEADWLLDRHPVLVPTESARP